MVYGGCKGEMKNSINYRECRYFKTEDDACCRYYFVTISYGDYVEEVLQELSQVPTDIIVMNSCLWDVHRHGKKGIEHYEDNLEKLVSSLRRLLPDCLFIWLTTPPVDIKSKGGFLMRPGQDLVKINEVKYCNQIAREVFEGANEIDRRFRIVDLGYVFQFFEHHRASDGVHWNERAHRRISNMILEEVSKAFNMKVPRILPMREAFNHNPTHEYYDMPRPPPPMFDQWDEKPPFHPDELPCPPPEQQNNWEYNSHQNGWDYENYDPRQAPPPPPPQGPVRPGGYPFGPPELPPPMPFGPTDKMRPTFMDRGLRDQWFGDLDDLGEARKQVEERQRQQLHGNEKVKEEQKQYRFGVSVDKPTVKRKLDAADDGKPSKVTIIETENGIYKKLISLQDGTTLHSILSENEKRDHLKQLEKERLEKEQKEKEEREKLDRQKQEKEKAEKEARERAEKEAIEKAEKEAKEKAEKEAKEKAEQERKEAEKKKEEEFAALKKLVDISSLPLVSEIPTKDPKENKEEKVQKGTEFLSKFASKLLSFINKPVNKLSDSVKGDTKDIFNEHVKSLTEVNPLDLVNHVKTIMEKPTNEMIKRFQQNGEISDEKPSILKTSQPFSTATNSNKSASTNSSAKLPSAVTTSSVFDVPSKVTKKVDTLALLSMQSPFAKMKVFAPPAPVQIKKGKNEDEFEPIQNRKVKDENEPIQNQKVKSENDGEHADNKKLKNEEEIENELLAGVDDGDLSDVDDSVLDDVPADSKTKPVKSNELVPKTSTVTVSNRNDTKVIKTVSQVKPPRASTLVNKVFNSKLKGSVSATTLVASKASLNSVISTINSKAVAAPKAVIAKSSNSVTVKSTKTTTVAAPKPIIAKSSNSVTVKSTKTIVTTSTPKQLVGKSTSGKQKRSIDETDNKKPSKKLKLKVEKESIPSDSSMDISALSDLNSSQSSQSSQITTDTETPTKKKKKKDKHPNETKEERRLRKQKKKEKKEKKLQEKMNKTNTGKKTEISTESAHKIETITNTNTNWNKPIKRSNAEHRQRSATWAPIPQPTSRSINNNQNPQTLLTQPQFVLQQQQTQPTISPTVVLNPYQTVLQDQQSLIQKQHEEHQQQLLVAQQQQTQQQEELTRQLVAQQQALIIQQQQQQQQQQAAMTQTAQDTIQAQQQTYNPSQQLYIDEYGQTYTLEEETYIVGPSGQIQNISAGTSALLQQQQQQQQGVQQQYIQSSLLYSQQQQGRFL